SDPAWCAPGGKAGGKAHREKAKDFTPKEAAQTARRQTGGRVLNIKPGNGGYRVKVLTPNGDVSYVPVDTPAR
ncbi:MAG: hypothetical protein WBG92_23650, partial [Thiohalocapsa sp.]